MYLKATIARPFVIGDEDRDGDIDLVDFSNWSGCMTGPVPPIVGPRCRVFDFESDGDVDLRDYAAFAAGFGL